MRKAILFLAIFTLSLSGFTQETDKLNEVKLNLPLTIFGSYPEVSYERILNPDISLGASFGIALDKERYPYQFMFTPYFRWFFIGNKRMNEKQGAGFFIEANGAVFTRTLSEIPYPGGSETMERESKTGAGLGVAIGWKYLSKNNWVGEIFTGVGRNFIKNKYNYQGYPRIGITIGKRF